MASGPTRAENWTVVRPNIGHGYCVLQPGQCLDVRRAVAELVGKGLRFSCADLHLHPPEHGFLPCGRCSEAWCDQHASPNAVL